jgi:AcrR family transcriptional regulator
MSGSSADHFANARFLDRPRIRTGSSDPEIAIFAATEKLLAEQPFADLSVSQIIQDAGISRATFYHYFSSKLGIIAGLLARVMDEMFETASPFLHHDGSPDIADSLRRSISAAMDNWSEHRILLRTVMENWASDVELEAQWFGAMSRFAEAVAVEIDEQRAAGKLPAGRPSRQLATALCWSTARCLYIAGRGLDPALGDEHAAVETLVTLWAGALELGGATAA